MSAAKRRQSKKNSTHTNLPSSPFKVVIQPKPLETLSPSLMQCGGKPLLRNRMESEDLMESFLSEEEEEDEEEKLLDQEDDADVSLMSQNVQLPREISLKSVKF